MSCSSIIVIIGVRNFRSDEWFESGTKLVYVLCVFWLHYKLDFKINEQKTLQIYYNSTI
jgi:hypothetical protein